MAKSWSPRVLPDPPVRRGRHGLALAAALVLTACSTGLAQNAARPGSKFYPDFSDTADALLRNAASHARDGQWGEAVDIYRRVIQQFGDKVARVPKDDPGADASGESLLYVDLRQFCQRKLAALPPEGRAAYRSRADAEAESWFRRGAAGRDRELLRRVIDQAFCSSWGDDAAEQLGDLAFQDGRFEEALACYGRVVPVRTAQGSVLTHPDPSVDLARVAAKQVLCRAALGETTTAAADLRAYATAYPDARGALAGRDGPYRETLAEALTGDRLDPPVQPDGRWPTFGGAPSRSRVVPGPIDVGSIQWRVELEPIISARSARYSRGFGMSSIPSTPDQKLGYHPIVVGDQVVVADESKVTAYNLNDRPEATTGPAAGTVKLAWRHDEEQGSPPQASRIALGAPRFTLTAFGDRIYVRMGPSSVTLMGRMGSGSPSYLVALDRATDGKLLWKKSPADVVAGLRQAEGLARTIGFEGSPLADARGVYVALTDRREQVSTYVACLDPETGATRWVRYLGAAASENENMFAVGMGMGGGFSGESGHRLLSLSGPTIYYQTNLGALVAMDTEAGSIRWVATYPRQERPGSGRDRDLNPAVVHEGLVIIAPDDAPAVYAFDAATGRLVWKTDPLPDEVKLSHLLGVARGRLVATGDRVLLFDVKDGKLVQAWPDTGHGYEAYGRGVLAGDRIYWPTRNEIHVLDQATGLRSEPSIKLQDSFQTTGGNLVVGDGYLVVAQADQLVVFCQNRRLIERYREEIARAPEQASGYFRLAQAAEATGQDALALEMLTQARAKAQPSETIDGGPLVDASRDQQFRLLMRLGDRARAAKGASEAEGRYRSAAVAARADRDRLRARLAEATAQAEAGRPADAVRSLQTLLQDPTLRSLTVAAEEGRRTVRADLLIGDRLSGLVKAGGRPVYAAFDSEARSLYERGRQEHDTRALEEVARNFPVAEVVPASLLELGRWHETDGHAAEASRAYKRLLALAPAGEYRGRALYGLARAYEAQGLWSPARDAYAEVLARFPDVRVEEGDAAARGASRLGEVASRRLDRAPFDSMAGGRSERSVGLPLARVANRTLDRPARPIAADGVPPTPDASRIFLATGGAIRPAGTRAGAPAAWTADLGGTPVWVGYLADRVLAATETRILALDLAKGGALWTFDSAPPAAAAPRRGPDPFAKPADSARAPREGGGALHGFRVLGGRVFCLRGERELLALDGDSGQVEWSFAVPDGAINPNLWVGPGRVVLQTLKPAALVVLETATGRRRGEFASPGGSEPWVREPLPLDDDRVALVTDRRTVTLFDLSRGTPSWVFRESQEMPKNGPPRLLGDTERLLLLHDGNELIRLDLATGGKKWSRPLGVEDVSERPEALALDGDRVYWANGASLQAAAVSDGAVVWTHHLSGPESGWSVALAGRCVLAYPGQPRKSGNELEGLPLVLRRRDDGGLVQRLWFPVPVTDVAVRFAPGGALVATQSGLWALGERSPVDGPGAGR